ncbi:MAG: FKBP-type peptidyl-prolyl cis-trans isomerase [Candidatus Obscuribacterales bacterium]|nr:FKBP-type peptidyl-prolyl cis-trans isomerase [Candidatus Obscuribacterales bacterium]
MTNRTKRFLSAAGAISLFLISFPAQSSAQGGGWPLAAGQKATTSQSGLQYFDITTGKGPQPRPGSKVTVHYTGWLTNKQKFDSSVDRKEPFTFTLGAGEVISGWDEGVATMKVGGTRRLVIPPNLGYGARGAGGAIPPNATLVFDVQLLKFE